MDKEQRQADCLTKAKEADERATQSKLPSDRAAWERIAASYRELAKPPEIFEL
jgi:hypothetical protein